MHNNTVKIFTVYAGMVIAFDISTKEVPKKKIVELHRKPMVIKTTLNMESINIIDRFIE